MDLSGLLYSDRLIVIAIKDHGGDKPLTAVQISALSGVTYTTCKRRLDALRRAQYFTVRSAGKRNGNYYRIAA